jgi:hypothetical protein
MGILVFYEGDGRIAGDIPATHWREISRLLPLAIDLINREMTQKQARPAPESLTVKPFKVELLLRDDSKVAEEINLLNRTEWQRLLGWWDFLSPLCEGLRFYQPVLESLRPQTRHPDEPG